MKHEIGITQPDYLIEDWPNKYQVFSWLEYIVTVPNPIFLVTTYKENGKPNANLHSWGFPVGDRDHYSFLLAILDGTHTFQNILRTGEFCVNYPSFQQYPAATRRERLAPSITPKSIETARSFWKAPARASGHPGPPFLSTTGERQRR